MAGAKEKSFDFYSVLGLKKECTGAELRNAYRKLAMKWHPDRCSASGNAGGMEEAKEKFQEIQNAYSVLSDSNKRLLYDFGVYDKDDDNDEQGMGDFIGEMAQMMSQTKSCSIDHGSLEELQRLFTEMFPDDLGASFSGRDCPSSAPASSSGQKRSNSEDTGKGKIGELDPSGSAFCLGSNDAAQSSKRRKEKARKKATGIIQLTMPRSQLKVQQFRTYICFFPELRQVNLQAYNTSVYCTVENGLAVCFRVSIYRMSAISCQIHSRQLAFFAIKLN